MNNVRQVWVGTLLFGLLLMLSPVLAAQKTKAHNAQVRHTFANVEQTQPSGLVVVLSAEAEVVTDDAGAAGPFRNLRGNGTPQITLTNPEAPIDAAGGENSSVDLIFRSYKNKLQIQTWWWIDERGKRIGKKQKG